MSDFTRSDHTTKWIAVNQLSVVWVQAQQPLNERRALRIGANLDPDKFGVILVCGPVGDTGLYHVIDGQHRVHGVTICHGGDQKVPCHVLPITDPQRAAEIFLGINGRESRKTPQAIDLFRVAVTAGYPGEVAVNKLITSMGYRVDWASRDGCLRAVTACMSIYRRGGIELLRDTLVILQSMWGRSAEAVDGQLLAGVSAFLEAYPLADRKRLIDRASKQYTPMRVIGAARNAREMFRGTIASNIVRVFVNTYNHGLRNGRLDEGDVRKKLNGREEKARRRIKPTAPALDPHSGIGLH